MYDEGNKEEKEKERNACKILVVGELEDGHLEDRVGGGA
jgi:hypothetical protein